MERILFSLKRAFRTSVEFCGRRILAPHGLTPSRFDIIYLLRYGGLSQLRIRRELGIASSTLSEMLSALERLGWIRRYRRSDDRRAFMVLLTDSGRLRAKAAIEQSITHRAALRAIREVFCWRKKGMRDDAYVTMETVENALTTIEAWFGLRVARLRYPSYWPEDNWRPPEETRASPPQ